jgi:hypothetical protein
MAITFTITRPNPDAWIVDIVETATSDGETRTLLFTPAQKPPKSGRIMRISSYLASGGATFIRPQLSTSSTDFSGPGVILETSPGTTIDEVDNEGIPFGLVGDKLYFRSNPSNSSNNAINTQILIKDGWGAGGS